MTDEELEAVSARLEAATPGPWRVERPSEHAVFVTADRSLGNRGRRLSLAAVEELAEQSGNADLIARAPSDLAALLAEVRLLRSMARDCERWAAGQEAGRLEALRWAMKDKSPDRDGHLSDPFFMWKRAGVVLEDVAGLPDDLFGLLEGGEAVRYHGKGARTMRRDYGSEAEAMADLAQALVRLARKGLPAEGEG